MRLFIMLQTDLQKEKEWMHAYIKVAVLLVSTVDVAPIYCLQNQNKDKKTLWQVPADNCFEDPTWQLPVA